ncbi:DUF2793 domain-containing protein [Streptomyces sp. SID8499]|uniref:DUF2793 domain-containing protein n=1 Tax=Streptomyces sp. SID8499 TaxID=2706106 RepID=UPI001EF3CFCC|nr:DUF2793 domain-containing protein [Streptomyces sp. SID8499]
MGQGIVDGLTPRSVMRFPSASVRGATIKTPVAGMVAWLDDVKRLEVYDGTAWVSFAFGTNAWKNISLASGFTANGNANGTPQYRVVNMFGEATIMLRGGIDVTYDANGIKNGGVINSVMLPVDARPSYRRSLVAACSVGASESAAVKVDINTNGSIAIVGTNKTDIKPAWVSLNGLFASL